VDEGLAVVFALSDLAVATGARHAVAEGSERGEVKRSLLRILLPRRIEVPERRVTGAKPA